MQPILSGRNSSLLKYIFIGSFFAAFYLYFLISNKFQLYYLEQTQLFRFSGDYFHTFTKKPGDLIFYLGEFLIQFFVNPAFSAFIITLLVGGVGSSSYLIFRKVGIKSLLISLLPVVFLVVLHSSYLYKVAFTVGILLVLSFVYGYLQIKGKTLRYMYGLSGWMLLYYLGGALALYASLFIVLAELLYFSDETKWTAIISIFLVSIAVPYVSVKYFFFDPFIDAWLYPMPLLGTTCAPLFIALLAFFLVVYSAILAYRKIYKRKPITITVNYKSIIAACLVVAGAVIAIKIKAYDPKTEIILGMDHYVQTGEWNKALNLSKKYAGVNQLVLYYTNLALYKTGQMGDRMFNYPQRGIKGLQLEWARDEVTPFFGGEIFYHLNYINEANRWAFESMVAKGLNPRSLKRLVLTNLVNGQYKVATKYLDLLDETIYYKGWAKKYRAYVADPDKIHQDSELAQKRHFLVKNDFISLNLGLNELLREHPDNRMAFEYLMATFLLNKDIKSFADNIYRLKDMGYKEIPVNYEEALLFCMAYFKKDLVPEGLRIRNATIQRKDQYISNIAQAGGDRNSAARKLYPQFGNTAWFYLHFADQN
jgi:hypothetical protein